MSSQQLKSFPSVALVPPAAATDRPTFEEIYEENVAFVWRSALRLGADRTQIDDVVQEVFLVLHRRYDEFEWRASIRTWLFGVVRRVVGHARRTARRKPSHLGGEDATDIDEFVTSDASPCESAEQAEDLRLVQRLLDTLDDTKREAFILAELEGMTIAEIAEGLDLNPNTVASRIRAARAAFDRALAEHESTNGGAR